MPRDILTLPAPPADLRLPYGTEPRQFIDFRIPPRPGPLVVHFHGGFWRNRFDLLHAGHFCAALTAAGFTTANVEYRSVGDAGGGWPGTLEDATAAFRFAASRFRGPVVATGHSAGGHVALWLAARESGLTAAVALAPVACLVRAWELQLGNGAVEEFLLGAPAQAPDVYAAACPSGLSSAVRRILIHGTADDIVPLSVSALYCERRAADPVSLIEIPGGDHFDPIDPRSQGFARVLAAVSSVS
jgi:acetyl esterase/lipase